MQKILDVIADQCRNFLEAEFGQHGGKGLAEGFRRLTLGKPELAVQGALVGYLRYRANLNAVQECSLVDGRNIDIIVFDENWFPACAIELKHRMSNQGPFDQLTRRLNADTQRHDTSLASGLPLLQIGLFTELQLRPEAVNPFGLYRFLSATYYNGPPRHTLDAQDAAGFELQVPGYTSFEVNGQKSRGPRRSLHFMARSPHALGAPVGIIGLLVESARRVRQKSPQHV